jgi:lipoprotein-anchoring transpeptidase ErfK/SrfK
MAFEKVEGLPVDGTAEPTMLERLEHASRPLPAATTGDGVEIDVTRQVLFVVRGGTTAWIFNVSTGTEAPYVYEGTTRIAHTPRGRYTMSRQIDAWRVSYLGRLYRPKYVVGGIAIHGSSLVPGFPASHGCIRVSLAAMDKIWAEGLIPLGSSVLIHGSNWQPPA